MSLDFYLEERVLTDVFSANITHNLGDMAREAGIYDALWHPERIGEVVLAHEIIQVLERGLAELKADPERFQKFDSPNGWGLYKHFVPFVEEVLAACKEHPEARVRASV